jgi:hypothetical protein
MSRDERAISWTAWFVLLITLIRQIVKQATWPSDRAMQALAVCRPRSVTVLFVTYSALLATATGDHLLTHRR